MQLRATLDRHQGAAIAASLGAIALVAIWISIRGSGNSIPKQLNFYTTDDGATLFADDMHKMPPFDHEGKPAVRAFVFTCDDGKHQFVQYLEKYPEKVIEQKESAHVMPGLGSGLIKKPGDVNWISESDVRAAVIVAPKPPPDVPNTGRYRQVLP